MAKSGNKKKSPVALFFFVFAAIVILMFVVNYKSRLVHELPAPQSGVRKLLTYGQQLVAISPSGEIYRWDWNDLSRQPRISSFQAQLMVVMSNERLAYIPVGINDVLIISNLQGNEELKRLSLGMDTACRQLRASSDGRYAVAVIATGYSGKQIQLAVIDPDSGITQPVMIKMPEEGLKPNDVSVSNDGKIIAAVGGADKGWLFVADTSNEEPGSRHFIEDCNGLNKVALSPDGQTVYAAESGRFVYVFDIVAEKLVRKLEIDKYKTPANYPQTISCVQVSPDGRLIAAASSPKTKAWIWDCKTGEKIITISTGHFSTSSMAFSPDSSLLAGADLTNKPIKVWRTSKSFLNR